MLGKSRSNMVAHPDVQISLSRISAIRKVSAARQTLTVQARRFDRSLQFCQMD